MERLSHQKLKMITKEFKFVMIGFYLWLIAFSIELLPNLFLLITELTTGASIFQFLFSGILLLVPWGLFAAGGVVILIGLKRILDQSPVSHQTLLIVTFIALTILLVLLVFGDVNTVTFFGTIFAVIQLLLMMEFFYIFIYAKLIIAVIFAIFLILLLFVSGRYHKISPKLIIFSSIFICLSVASQIINFLPNFIIWKETSVSFIFSFYSLTILKNIIGIVLFRMYITFYNPDQEITLEYSDPLARSRLKPKRKKIRLSKQTTDIPKIKNSNIKTFEFLSGYFKKSCGICKTILRNKEVVAECPHCKALFHIKHLKKRLENNSHCPICQQEILSNNEEN